MKGLMTFGMAIAAVLALAACGGRGSSGAASSAAGSDTSSTTVSVRQLSGVGSVLVDHTGKALYSSDLEAGGKIVCDDAACTAFWKPLTVGGGMQVTINAKPLYTFSEDSPGKATGDGFTDDFGGHHFTWNVVRAGGTTTSGVGSGSGGGAPSSTGGSGGSPGY